MKYTYTAKKSTGETYTNTVEAEGKTELYAKVRDEGGSLVSYKEAGGLKEKFSKINTIFGRVKLQEKIVFARNLGAMIEAGLPLARALSVMERQTRNKLFKSVLHDIIQDVNKGKTLSASMKGFPKIFPPVFIFMVKAGEESGNLTDSLHVVANQLEKTYLLKKKVRGAMMYPSIVVAAMILVGILMMMFVVPTLTETFKELGVDLPISTRIIIGISDFLSNNIILSFGLLAASIFAVVFAFRTPKGKRLFDFVILKIPVIGELVKETNSARTTRTLASLLSAGVEIVSALSITKDVIQNFYYKKVLEEAEERIQKGSTISDVFSDHEDIYPILVGEMISVGEETGKLGELLSQTASFYEDDVEQRTKDLSTIIEPVLMVIIGTVVGFFAVSMISPMYSLVGGI